MKKLFGKDVLGAEAQVENRRSTTKEKTFKPEAETHDHGSKSEDFDRDSAARQASDEHDCWKDPVLFKPSVWLPEHVVSNKDFALAIQTKLPHILRNYQNDPEGALKQASHIIFNTMGVEKRHIVRPAFGLYMKCSNIFTSEPGGISLVELELGDSGEMGKLEAIVKDINLTGRVGFTVVQPTTGDRDEGVVEPVGRSNSFDALDASREIKELGSKESPSSSSTHQHKPHVENAIKVGMDAQVHPLLFRTEKNEPSVGNVSVDNKVEPPVLPHDESWKKVTGKYNEELVLPGEHASVESGVLLVPLENPPFKVGDQLIVDGLPELSQKITPQLQRDIFIKLAQRELCGDDGLIAKALEEAALTAEDIDYVIVSTHQPYPFPNLYHYLTHLVPFKKTCKPMVTQAGCAASAVALDMALTLLLGNPTQNVLILSLEFCSLGFRPHKQGMSVFLNSALFGDCASACVMRGGHSVRDSIHSVHGNEGACGLRVLAGKQECVPHVTHVSYFDYDQMGYHFVTTKELCDVVEKHVPGFAADLTAKTSERSSVSPMGAAPMTTVSHVIHPGGSKMVDAMEKNTAVDISQKSIARMRSSLRDGGNLASSTVLRMASEAWNELTEESRSVIIIAMGPGFHMAGIGAEPVNLKVARTALKDLNGSDCQNKPGIMDVLKSKKIGSERAAISNNTGEFKNFSTRSIMWLPVFLCFLHVLIQPGGVSVSNRVVRFLITKQDVIIGGSVGTPSKVNVTPNQAASASHQALIHAASVILDGPPDKNFAVSPAMVSVGKSSGEYRDTVRTHAQLHADADRAAAIIRHHMPPRSNGRVMIAVTPETTYEYDVYVLMLACFKNAFTYANVARQMWHPRFPEVVEIIDPAVIVLDGLTSESYSSVMNSHNTTRVVLALDFVPGVPNMILVEEDIPWKSYLSALPYTPKTFPLSKEAILTFTSGSTGLPKVVASSYEAVFVTATNSQKLLSHDPSEKIVCPLGMDDSAGLDNVYVPSLIFGACVMPIFDTIFRSSFQEEEDEEEEEEDDEKEGLLEYLLANDATAAVVSPHQLDKVVDAVSNMDPEDLTLTLQSMRTILTIGSKLLPACIDEAILAFSREDGTHVKIYETYGSSEAHLIGSRDVTEADALTLCDGVEVRVEPLDENPGTNSRKEVNATLGSIILRSSQMMIEYLNSGTDTPLDDEGWYETGDVGFFTENKLTIAGRSRKSINFGGDEYDPSVIESTWREILPQVKELVVVRDLSHTQEGQTAVLFCRGEQHSFDWKDFALTAVHQTNFGIDVTKESHEVALMLTSAICFVDEFPRVARDKVNAPQVERLYGERVKPSLAGFVEDDVEDILFLSLKWNMGERQWDLLEWVQKEIEFVRTSPREEGGLDILR